MKVSEKNSKKYASLTDCICPGCRESHQKKLKYPWAGTLPARLICRECERTVAGAKRKNFHWRSSS